MALAMRTECECCGSKLDDSDECYICVQECTWCPECTEDLDLVCPNCGGELVRRPRPPTVPAERSHSYPVDGTPRVASEEIRYQGKAVDDEEWIVGFLHAQESGVLGLVYGGSPHLVTQLFVYDIDSGAIYLHGAQAGRAYDIVEANEPAVATFTCSNMGRYIPADQPVNFTVEYASVVADGTITLVQDFEEKRRILEQLMSKYAPHLAPGEDYEEMQAESIDRTAVYRLDVESWTAKEGFNEPDTPGAYTLNSDTIGRP